MLHANIMLVALGISDETLVTRRRLPCRTLCQMLRGSNEPRDAACHTHSPGSCSGAACRDYGQACLKLGVSSVEGDRRIMPLHHTLNAKTSVRFGSTSEIASLIHLRSGLL